VPCFNHLPLRGGFGFLYRGALYTTRLRGFNLNGLYVLLYDLRLLLPLLGIITPSTIKPSIMYKGHNQYTLIIKHTSNIHCKGDIRHYSTIKGIVDLVYAGIINCCANFFDLRNTV